jgi:small subunit ribosomal protein S9
MKNKKKEKAPASSQEKTEKLSKVKKAPAAKEAAKTSFYQAVGRRKEATARVRLYLGGKGEIIVNGLPVEKYFSGEIARIIYLKPLKLTDNLDRFRISVKVEGSGKSGQMIAMVHAISRALLKIDKDKYRPILKKAGFLTRDSRIKERRKAGFAGKARAKKQSPKR